MNASDRERIVEADQKKERVEGEANRAKAEVEQYRKSCKAKDLKIARLVAEKAAREEAFNAERELLEKSLSDHAKMWMIFTV